MHDDAPLPVTADSDYIPDILDLILRNFAYMEPRINPPSSMHQLSVDTIRQHCRSGEVLMIGPPPIACVFLSVKGSSLYIGKLAVDATQRGQGLARRLITLAEQRASAKALSALELQTRIELTENYRAFRQLGFIQTGETCHPGFDRPTSITMRKSI